MALNTIWQFATAGNIRFGRGCSSLLPTELLRHQVQRPLLVTDARLSGLPAVNRIIDAVRAGCGASHVTVFDGCEAEPSIEVAEAAVTAGRRHGQAGKSVDGVIAIGGGSNIDVAKMAAAVLQHGGAPQDYFGFDAIQGPVLPLFALPTTAGTGSEVSHSAVLTDTAAGVKVSTLSRWLRPLVAIVDPALTDSCPPKVTAHSGIDALVHAIEACTNRDYTQMVDIDPQARAYEGSYPLTRLLAAEAIRLIGQSLALVVERPSDATRDAMALAAMFAGMAFSNSGVALVHALEYPVGALTHCSHGEGNGLLLPHVMRFNQSHCTAELSDIARWLGADTRDCDHYAAAELAIAEVEKLQRAVGIRLSLRELGLLQEQLPSVAAKSFAIKRLMDVNPRRPTESDLLKILEAAF